MTMKGSIKKELINPAVSGKWSGDRHHGVKIPFSMMEQSIRKIASITRTDDPFNESRRGNVILRKRLA